MFTFLKTHYKTSLRSAFAASFLITLVTCAHAQVGFTFSVADQTTNSGTDAIYYDGTITNGAQSATLTSYKVNFDIPDVVDSSPLEDYYNNTAPVPLPADYSYDLTTFALYIPYSTATNTYFGTLELNYLLGGVESSTVQNFSLGVTQVSGFGFSLDASDQTIDPGGSIVFSATLENGATDSTITDFNFAFDNPDPGLTIDSSAFETSVNANDTVLASTNVKEELFRVGATNTVAPGDYTGLAQITYTTNGVSSIAERSFTVHVQSFSVVPEPGTLVLIAGAFSLLVGVVIRRKLTK